MTYSLQVSDNQKHIVITIDGTIKNNTSLECAIEAHKLAAEKEITKFLLDLRKAKNQNSLLDKHEFINKDMNNAKEINKDARIAILVNKNDQSHNLFEALFREGGYTIKTFRDLDSTLGYLAN